MSATWQPVLYGEMSDIAVRKRFIPTLDNLGALAEVFPWKVVKLSDLPTEKYVLLATANFRTPIFIKLLFSADDLYLPLGDIVIPSPMNPESNNDPVTPLADNDYRILLYNKAEGFVFDSSIVDLKTDAFDILYGLKGMTIKPEKLPPDNIVLGHQLIPSATQAPAVASSGFYVMPKKKHLALAREIPLNDALMAGVIVASATDSTSAFYEQGLMRTTTSYQGTVLFGKLLSGGVLYFRVYNPLRNMEIVQPAKPLSPSRSIVIRDKNGGGWIQKKLLSTIVTETETGFQLTTSIGNASRFTISDIETSAIAGVAGASELKLTFSDGTNSFTVTAPLGWTNGLVISAAATESFFPVAISRLLSSTANYLTSTQNSTVLQHVKSTKLASTLARPFHWFLDDAPTLATTTLSKPGESFYLKVKGSENFLSSNGLDKAILDTKNPVKFTMIAPQYEYTPTLADKMRFINVDTTLQLIDATILPAINTGVTVTSDKDVTALMALTVGATAFSNETFVAMNHDGNSLYLIRDGTTMNVKGKVYTPDSAPPVEWVLTSTANAVVSASTGSTTVPVVTTATVIDAKVENGNKPSFRLQLDGHATTFLAISATTGKLTTSSTATKILNMSINSVTSSMAGAVPVANITVESPQFTSDSDVVTAGSLGTLTAFYTNVATYNTPFYVGAGGGQFLNWDAVSQTLTRTQSTTTKWIFSKNSAPPASTSTTATTASTQAAATDLIQQGDTFWFQQNANFMDVDSSGNLVTKTSTSGTSLTFVAGTVTVHAHTDGTQIGVLVVTNQNLIKDATTNAVKKVTSSTNFAELLIMPGKRNALNSVAFANGMLGSTAPGSVTSQLPAVGESMWYTGVLKQSSTVPPTPSTVPVVSNAAKTFAQDDFYKLQVSGGTYNGKFVNIDGTTVSIIGGSADTASAFKVGYYNTQYPNTAIMSPNFKATLPTSSANATLVSASTTEIVFLRSESLATLAYDTEMTLKVLKQNGTTFDIYHLGLDSTGTKLQAFVSEQTQKFKLIYQQPTSPILQPSTTPSQPITQTVTAPESQMKQGDIFSIQHIASNQWLDFTSPTNGTARLNPNGTSFYPNVWGTLSGTSWMLISHTIKYDKANNAVSISLQPASSGYGIHVVDNTYQKTDVHLQIYNGLAIDTNNTDGPRWLVANPDGGGLAVSPTKPEKKQWKLHVWGSSLSTPAAQQPSTGGSGGSTAPTPAPTPPGPTPAPTPGPAPVAVAPPTNIQVSRTSNTTATITWTPAPNTPSGALYWITSEPSGISQANITATSVTLTTLNETVTYAFRIQAKSNDPSAQYGVPSNRTSEFPPPEAIKTTTGTGTGTDAEKKEDKLFFEQPWFRYAAIVAGSLVVVLLIWRFLRTGKAAPASNQ